MPFCRIDRNMKRSLSRTCKLASTVLTLDLARSKSAVSKQSVITQTLFGSISAASTRAAVQSYLRPLTRSIIGTIGLSSVVHTSSMLYLVFWMTTGIQDPNGY
jgi:hypothetical protein